MPSHCGLVSDLITYLFDDFCTGRDGPCNRVPPSNEVRTGKDYSDRSAPRRADIPTAQIQDAHPSLVTAFSLWFCPVAWFLFLFLLDLGVI